MKITITLPDSTPNYVGWRCLHKGEAGGYDKTPDGMPEVRPSVDAPPIPFTRELQELSWALMKLLNPAITSLDWRYIFGDKIAFTNGQGWENDRNDPRVDYVNGRDIGAPLPMLMKAIICGGMFIRGDVVGSELVCRPGVHAIDGTQTPPDISTVVKNQWYFYAVDWFATPTPHVYDFTRGHGGRVPILYVLKETVRYPLSWFGEWNAAELPDPLKLYTVL